jgi:hypothetical protein
MQQGRRLSGKGGTIPLDHKMTPDPCARQQEGSEQLLTQELYEIERIGDAREENGGNTFELLERLILH